VFARGVTGKAAPFCELKKGGAAMIEIPAPATPGQGVLRWLLSPAVLRTISP